MNPNGTLNYDGHADVWWFDAVVCFWSHCDTILLIAMHKCDDGNAEVRWWYRWSAMDYINYTFNALQVNVKVNVFVRSIFFLS